jgi:arrestin-related trafficking adapter 3/6
MKTAVMTTDNHPQKSNTLSIRLTEPVVFLNAGSNRGRQHQNSDPGPPSMLRGLLTFTVIKRTRIVSIEVELQGKTRCAWREGVYLQVKWTVIDIVV